MEAGLKKEFFCN